MNAFERRNTTGGAASEGRGGEALVDVRWLALCVEGACARRMLENELRRGRSRLGAARV